MMLRGSCAPLRQTCAVVALVLAACLALPADSASAHGQQLLTAPANLEVVGELRPGTPNIPLLLVVQWDPVPGAELYELERAEPPPAGSPPSYVAVAILTPADVRPNGRIGFVDSAGFAQAGGDCFRVRAARGGERSEWSSKCLPVPPSSGGPIPPEAFQFRSEFSKDLELTIVSWIVPPELANATFEVWAQGTFVPLVVLPASARSRPAATVFLHRRSGCFSLKVAGMPDIEAPCSILPTDLRATRLETGLLPEPAAVGVRATGRTDVPVAVLWRATGGPTDLLFRIERLQADGAGVRSLVSYAGARFGGDVLSFFDTAIASERPCYRVTAVSSAGESILGEACLEARPPGPPDAGTGLAGRRHDDHWRFGMLLVAASIIGLGLRLTSRAGASKPPI